MLSESVQFEQNYLAHTLPTLKQDHTLAPIKSQEIMRLQVSFPSKLYNLLESTDKDIIDWLPNEKAFCVHDMQRFVTLILPQYFNHSKFGSFQRQLNTYGFKRILRGYHLGAYFHPDFQKGRLDLLSKIKRIVPTKGLVCNEMLNLEVDAPSPSGDRMRKRMKTGSVSAPVSPSPAWTGAIGYGPVADQSFNYDMSKQSYSQFELSTSYDSYATDNSQSSYTFNNTSSSDSYDNCNGVLQSSSYDVDANRSVKIQYQDGVFNGITEITIDPNVLSTFGEIYYLPNQGGRPIRIKAVPLLASASTASLSNTATATVAPVNGINNESLPQEATFTNFDPDTDLLASALLDDRAGVPSSSCSISSEPSDITLEEQKGSGLLL